jgi:adenosine deaminase CECR1
MTMRIVRLSILLTALPALLAADDFSGRYDEIRSQATPEQLYKFLYALPKGGDLHNHFSGSIIPEWKWDILTDPSRNGGDIYYARVRFDAAPDAIDPRVLNHTIRHHTYENLPGAKKSEYVPLKQLTATERESWLNAFRLDAPGEGRHEFFAYTWDRLGDIHRNPHVRFELLAEHIKAFAGEGLRYLETMFGLYTMTDNEGRGLSDEEMLALMEARLAQPDVASTGVELRFLETILRFTPDALRDLELTYAWINAHRDRWVGINMAGIEENGKGYPLRFLDTYRQLRAKYPTLPLSIHAGEMDSPDKNIRETLLLGASRIGHGVNILGDPDTLLMLQHSNRTLIEIQLVSNRLLEYVPNLDEHPFPELLRTGVPVCLNTDDRGMWDSNMTDEYYTAVSHFNLSWAELTQLARNSLRHAFVEEATKQRLLASYEKDLAAFVAQFAGKSTADVLVEIDRINAVSYGYARRTWGFDFTRN